MRFTRKDEDKLVRVLHRYGEQELREFIGKAITERALLIMSLGEEGADVTAINAMLNTISRVQRVAEDELKRREAIAGALRPYMCEACGRKVCLIIERNHGPEMCADCWVKAEDGSNPVTTERKAEAS